jgi:hypothetical protein
LGLSLALHAKAKWLEMKCGLGPVNPGISPHRSGITMQPVRDMGPRGILRADPFSFLTPDP